MIDAVNQSKNELASISEAAESLSRQLATAEAENERLKKWLSDKAFRLAALEACAELGQVGPLVANLVSGQLRARIDDRGVRIEVVDEKGNTRLAYTSNGATPLTARDVLRQVKQTAMVRKLLEPRDEQEMSARLSAQDVTTMSLTEKTRLAAKQKRDEEVHELEGMHRICKSANPFSREHLNVTLQTRLVKLDPQYAQKLQQEAA